MSRRKDDDDGEDAHPSPFVGIEKSNVLREARQRFNDQYIDSHKCAEILTKIVYLITLGEKFTSDEATDLFFACTKLFQSQDAYLRRMVYLVLKDIHVGSDESLIVVACLQKDITSKIDLFRGNSIRVLCKLMDPSMVGQIERFLKQAAVDRNPFIVGSTLAAAQHLMTHNSDLIKRWSNEVSESLNNTSRMVQFHGLSLTYHIKKHDKLAISKVMTQLARAPPKGPIAQVLQIRITTNILRHTQPLNPELFKFLSDCLYNKNFMVMYEAARSIVSLEKITQVQIAPAIEVLQGFLGSTVPAQKFAAVRTLSEAVVRFPSLVAPCSADLEQLLGDSNRSIATLAITTLLKTGQEAHIDRHMQAISGFMPEISDDFKIVIVESVKALCFKFPYKHQKLMTFMLSTLRDEGGFRYKKSIVNALLDVINTVKDSKEYGLDLFCEYIEDCEFPELSVRIINMLGENGPRSSNPSKFIRFLFNRVILEVAHVRSAAVTCLAKFGAAVPALTQNIMVLLKRTLSDNDDEVRDRAVLYLSVLQSKPKLATLLLMEEKRLEPNMLCDLEYSLQKYLGPTNDKAAPFNLQQHLIIRSPEEQEKDASSSSSSTSSSSTSSSSSFSSSSSAGGLTVDSSSSRNYADANPYLDLLNGVVQIKDTCGALWKSCAPVELTEQETEYVVNCVKHIYAEHVVFQFNITNNLKDEELTGVSVDMEPANDDWEVVDVVPEKKVEPGVGGITFVIMKRSNGALMSGGMPCTLKFHMDGSEDEYQLEEVEVVESDYMKRSAPIGLLEFKSQWEVLGDTVEVVKKYSLGLDKLQSAVDAVIDLLGTTACEEHAKVPDGAKNHSICMHGTFFGGVPVYCRALFLINNGINLKIAVRSAKPELCTLLTQAIR